MSKDTNESIISKFAKELEADKSKSGISASKVLKKSTDTKDGQDNISEDSKETTKSSKDKVEDISEKSDTKKDKKETCDDVMESTDNKKDTKKSSKKVTTTEEKVDDNSDSATSSDTDDADCEETKSCDAKDKEHKSDKIEQETKVTDHKKKVPDKVKKSESDAKSKETLNSGTNLVKVDVAKSADIDNLATVLRDSYNLVTKRQESFYEEISTMKSTVDSIKNDLLPLIEKMAKVLPEDDTTEVITEQDPEEVATKSAKLEDEQHAEDIKKSADASQDGIAKDETTEVVDDVIKKSDSVVETQTAKVDTKPKAMTSEELRYAAMGSINPFFNRMTSDVHKGNIPETAISHYQSMISDIQTGDFDDKEAEAFIAYAQGK